MYGWHISRMGVWDGGEREVLSSHIGVTGLVCFVLSRQFKTLATGWFMSLMLLELVQLLSIWEKLQRPSQSKATSVHVCLCECVGGMCALLKL